MVMATNDRLRRYLTDELGECCDEDVEQRVDELEELGAQTDETALKSDVQVLSALANETRYKIVRLLHATDGELCVCEFSPLLDVSESAISHALSDLTKAGLVTRRKDGKWRKYRATGRATALLVALDGTQTA